MWNPWWTLVSVDIFFDGKNVRINSAVYGILYTEHHGSPYPPRTLKSQASLPNELSIIVYSFACQLI